MLFFAEATYCIIMGVSHSPVIILLVYSVFTVPDMISLNYKLFTGSGWSMEYSTAGYVVSSTNVVSFSPHGVNVGDGDKDGCPSRVKGGVQEMRTVVGAVTVRLLTDSNYNLYNV